MNGHLQILKARMEGSKPTAVFLEAGLEPMPAASKYDDPEKALHFGLYPTVNIPPDEMGKRHDLRFLAGLRVHVHGEAMTDEFLAVVDQVAAIAEHTIVIADGEMMENKNGAWQAWC